MTPQKIRTRIAPSPTGPCHLGTARTALFNYLFAKHHGGTFIFRLEDTDRERSTREFEQELYDSLHWLGLHWDEGPDVGGDLGPYRQSERGEHYRAAIEKLLESGHAYRCFCAPGASDATSRSSSSLRSTSPCKCRERPPEDTDKPFAVRFRMPDETFTFNDLIRGEVTVEGSGIADFIIARPNGSPIFHLSNVVDDAEMRITHIMRGEDHLPNVPKHIALFRALGYEPPLYAHLPLILNPDGSKMSKRKAIEGLEPYVRVFREKGYLPEAMVSYLALLGWSPGAEEEILTLDELAKRFSIEAISKSGARFDLQKLDAFNGHFIRGLSHERFVRELKTRLPETDNEYLEGIARLIQERLKRFDDAKEYTGFFFVPKGHTTRGTVVMIKEVLKWLEHLPEQEFTAKVLEEKMRATAEQEPYNWKARHLFMAVRVALTGSKATPPLFETMQVLGKERCIRWLQTALGRLEEGQD